MLGEPRTPFASDLPAGHYPWSHEHRSGVTVLEGLRLVELMVGGDVALSSAQGPLVVVAVTGHVGWT